MYRFLLVFVVFTSIVALAVNTAAIRRAREWRRFGDGGYLLMTTESGSVTESDVRLDLAGFEAKRFERSDHVELPTTGLFRPNLTVVITRQGPFRRMTVEEEEVGVARSGTSYDAIHLNLTGYDVLATDELPVGPPIRIFYTAGISGSIRMNHATMSSEGVLDLGWVGPRGAQPPHVAYTTINPYVYGRTHRHNYLSTEWHVTTDA